MIIQNRLNAGINMKYTLTKRNLFGGKVHKIILKKTV